MLQILASLLILLNPILGFFAVDRTTISGYQISRISPTPLIDLNDYKLPLPENIFLAAQFAPSYPIRNWNISEPQITAKIALVFDATRQKVLWQKDGLRESRPIASLTKIMTALVVIENAKLEDVFTVSKNAVNQNGEMGGLAVGEKLTAENLLYALLVESSNDAAMALAENIASSTQQNFVDLMNAKAKPLGLTDTTFADPSGLDPGNRSSAWDLNRLMQKFLEYPVLQKITQTAAYDFQSVDKKFQHHLTGTNKLLGQYPEIIGGKTGYTEEAGNCMILAWRAPLGGSPLTGRAPNNQGIVISIIMDSQDRLAESETLLQWTKKAFLW